MLTLSQPLKDVFFCPEESSFYSHSLETLILKDGSNPSSIIEFGSGDGSPVINSLLRTNFNGIIHGFELNNLAYQAAKSKIKECGLTNKYRIYNHCFLILSDQLPLT